MNQRFQLGEVAEVIAASPNTIKSWLHRDLVASQEDSDPAVEGGRDAGTRRSFSIHAVMQIAVAKEIIDFGMRDTERAFLAAAVFAHVGKGPSGWVGEKPDMPGQRLPGMPYHYSLGKTVLIVTDNGGKVELAHNLDILLVCTPACMVVDVSEIFYQVCARLVKMTGNNGFHPSALMDAAYPADTVGS